MQNMSCCENPKALTKADFIAQKLKNFREFLEPHCTSDEQKAALKTYSTVDAVAPLLLQAVAAQSMGAAAQEALLTKFCAEFPTADAAFKAKVGRYLSMFCDVMTT